MLKKLYTKLECSNEEISFLFKEKKQINREHFEAHKVRYWLFLLLLNFQYNILLKGTNQVNYNKEVSTSYQLPPILTSNEKQKAVEIISCAFRKHEPNKGLTGGPNGVLATEKEVFGDIYHGLRMRYMFMGNTPQKYPEHLERALSGIAYMVKINFYAAYCFERVAGCWARYNSDTDFFFICHDLGYAYGAYLSGCKYILVWHTQGSMINERESFGEKLTERDKELLNQLEKTVFENAEAVYFPSVGAKESYLETMNIDTSNITFGEEPLYNTISQKPKIETNKQLFKLNLPDINRESTDVFLSVGDFSFNKGMERVPQFLNLYVEYTGRNVFWIAIGSKHNSTIFDDLIAEKDSWKFKSCLFGERTDHNTLLALMDYTDYYIMMQRHSIFDLSTLEAMRAGKGLILSALGGNLELNKRENVILTDVDDMMSSVKNLSSKNKSEFGALNEEVFNEYFSQESFFKSYGKIIDQYAVTLYDVRYDMASEINRKNLSKWKNYYHGKKVVICGAGGSLDHYKMIDNNAIHIALNRALFFDKIHFDFSFLQDYPMNQPYELCDYNKYDCVKMYGIITNPYTKHLGFNLSDEDKATYNIYNYELASMWFDKRVDKITFDLDKECVIDAKSVLFSALQFSVFAGFSEIVLYGIDFSTENFGNIKNPNKYNGTVPGDLIFFKEVIKRDHPEISFRFGSTTNDYLKEQFDLIDEE